MIANAIGIIFIAIIPVVVIAVSGLKITGHTVIEIIRIEIDDRAVIGTEGTVKVIVRLRPNDIEQDFRILGRQQAYPDIVPADQAAVGGAIPTFGFDPYIEAARIGGRYGEGFGEDGRAAVIVIGPIAHQVRIQSGIGIAVGFDGAGPGTIGAIVDADRFRRTYLGIHAGIGSGRTCPCLGRPCSGSSTLEIAVDRHLRIRRFGAVGGNVEIQVIRRRAAVLQDKADFAAAVADGIGRAVIYRVGEFLLGAECCIVGADDARRIDVQRAADAHLREQGGEIRVDDDRAVDRSAGRNIDRNHVTPAIVPPRCGGCVTGQQGQHSDDTQSMELSLVAVDESHESIHGQYAIVVCDWRSM